jgi:hypothetical protein
VRRREFLGLFGGLSTIILGEAAYGLEAPKRVALVSVGATPTTKMNEGSSNIPTRTFFEELRRLGYVEGKNLIVQRFSSGARSERIPETALSERPGDLPFYRASRYQLIINRKTAETLNLSIPPILQTAADEIIGN